jgi:Flp pilus assembly pilin Flp
MAALHTLFVKLVKEETGTETIEYAVITGLVVAAAIAGIAFVGRKMSTQWTMIKISKI